ncbi:MAG: TetR/AcrR family transcriptional regulator [Paraglaciecola sp.]|nr:TetR/AcrR family transcriptional regulator [Paraglaciecola sp.]NCT47831.1 TetR/AcrR family transcriptional regulator [Paraglaciecola sp.]
MKTAERILVTSLDIFNQQGEANVSSVDIALELDISPGNLYYHFKGKEVIVAALFDLYAEQMRHLLDAPLRQSHQQLSVEEFFYFLFLVLEKNHLFRFLYRNPIDLSDKYPSIAKGFSKLIRALENSITQILSQFVAQQQIVAAEAQRKQMVEVISLVFNQAANYYSLKEQDLNSDSYVYKSLSMILFALLPYLNIAEGELHAVQDAISNEEFSHTE